MEIFEPVSSLRPIIPCGGARYPLFDLRLNPVTPSAILGGEAIDSRFNS